MSSGMREPRSSADWSVGVRGGLAKMTEVLEKLQREAGEGGHWQKDPQAAEATASICSC